MIGRNSPDGPRDPEDKINGLEIAALKEEIIRTGTSTRSMLSYFHVDKISDLTVDQWRQAVLIFEEKPNRPKNGGRT